MSNSSQFIVDKNQVCWFVMRAYKSEAFVEEKLRAQKELQFFIPKQYVVRVYHGKKTRKLVPVISSIIFIYGSRVQISEFKQRCESLQFVMWRKSTGPEFMTVPEDQMQNFMKVASDLERSNTYFRPEELHLKKGTKVRIIGGGSLDGTVGYFEKVKNSRSRKLVVILEGISAIVTEVSPDLVEVLKD